MINTTTVAYRGFNLVQLDVSSCSPSNILHFDTHATTTNSDNMATYINGLSLYTVLIGVTSGEAQGSLTQNAKSALLAIGVNVAGLQFRGKVSFVAQIGQPAMTVSQVAPPGGSNLDMTVTGTDVIKITHRHSDFSYSNSTHAVALYVYFRMCMATHVM